MITSTIAGGVILNLQGKIAIVEQKNNKWSLPKGHINEGESLEEGARREIYEETGLTDLKLIRKLGSYQRFKIGKDEEEDTSELKKITIFLFTTNQQNLEPIDKDNPSALWVNRKEVASHLSHQKDKEFFLSILDGIESFRQVNQ